MNEFGFNYATGVKKMKAESFYITFGISQKDTARLVGVTAKTLSGWIKSDNWNQQRKDRLKERAFGTINPVRLLNTEFLMWVNYKSPASAELLREWMVDFICSKTDVIIDEPRFIDEI